MATIARNYSADMKFNPTSRLAAILRRVPLVMVTVIFTIIGIRGLVNPVTALSSRGIAFNSAGGVTMGRVGFGAFPLTFAILAASCLISPRRLLSGLYMALTLVTVVIAVRLFGIASDHSASQSARLLIPEMVLLTLSVNAIRMELSNRRASMPSKIGE